MFSRNFISKIRSELNRSSFFMTFSQRAYYFFISVFKILKFQPSTYRFAFVAIKVRARLYHLIKMYLL